MTMSSDPFSAPVTRKVLIARMTEAADDLEAQWCEPLHTWEREAIDCLRLAAEVFASPVGDPRPPQTPPASPPEQTAEIERLRQENSDLKQHRRKMICLHCNWELQWPDDESAKVDAYRQMLEHDAQCPENPTVAALKNAETNWARTLQHYLERAEAAEARLTATQERLKAVSVRLFNYSQERPFHHPGCRKILYDMQSSPCTCLLEASREIDALLTEIGGGK